jgi:RNA recognition motif-containing protein
LDRLETIIIKKGSRPKGFGFVAFKTLEEAEKAVEIFDKKEFDGREISVQLAIQRSPEELEAAKNEKKKKQQQKRKSGSNKKSRKSASAAVTVSFFSESIEKILLFVCISTNYCCITYYIV